MSPSLAAGRVLAGRRSPAHLRRYLKSRPNAIAREIANLSEEERALVSKHVTELDAELQSKLVRQVDAFFQIPTFSNDLGLLNRVLTFCRVPKGERRDKLMWRSSLAATFLASAVMGKWEAKKCLQYLDEYQKKHEEKAPASGNHAA